MTNAYPIPEQSHAINGVPGRMYAVNAPQTVRGRLVHRGQKWVSEARKIEGFGTGGTIFVEVRFDDECGNAHQTFGITASVYTLESRRRNDCAACGCLHDEIAAVFPELAPLIKWHGCSTDGPWGYPANVLYFAGDRDCWGRRAGEPSSWDDVIYFGDSAVHHKIKASFAKFLRERIGTGDFQVVAIAADNKPGGYQFKPKFTFNGYGEKWHECPFDDKHTADEWAAALNTGKVRFDRIPTAYSDGQARELDKARNAAIWPEATDEELCAEPESLKAVLLARLPALMAEFRADMEKAGLLWEPEQASAD